MRMTKQKETVLSLYDVFSSTNMNGGEIKSRRIGWAGHVKLMGLNRNA